MNLKMLSKRLARQKPSKKEIWLQAVTTWDVGSNPTLSAKFCIAKFGEISPF